jgi:hypothetical protein
LDLNIGFGAWLLLLLSAIFAVEERVLFLFSFVGFLNVERGANESGWRVIFVSREIGFWRAG